MSGTGVPEGFTLPWNVTVTMADVWAGEFAEHERIRIERKAQVQKQARARNAELRAEAERVADRERQKRFLAGYQRQHSNLSDNEGASNI